MKTYPYILYTESNGKREAVFNEKEEPTTLNSALWTFLDKKQEWQSNHITLEVDEIEADKIKQNIDDWYDLLKLEKGIQVTCLTINESGKAVFFEPEKTGEVDNINIHVNATKEFFNNKEGMDLLESLIRKVYNSK